MSRGPGRLQRDILRAVAQAGPISTGRLSARCAGIDPTRQRAHRRAVQTLLAAGRLVELDGWPPPPAELEALRQQALAGQSSQHDWRVVALPEQLSAARPG